MPPAHAQYPCVSLIYSGWDDYGYKTSYDLVFHPLPGDATSIGVVKILRRGALHADIPKWFERLDENFCSLGQALEYYQAILKIGVKIYHQLFTALNDVVYNEKIAEAFREEPGFSKSLVRFSEAEKAFKEAGQLFKVAGAPEQKKQFNFRFISTVPGSEAPHEVDFDFRPDQTNLYRVTALIGRNGTGKTQVLANFANAMSGLKQNVGAFEPQRPNFSKVIAISYSVFDHFQRPEEGIKTFSYKYCGIREGDRFLGPEEIQRKLINALRQVEIQNRGDHLTDIFTELLGPSIDTSELRTPDGKLNLYLYERLSSGQSILVLVMAEVVANIAEESVILFDEPEIHLHPDALAAVARALHLLLEKFNSFAIIATHSPIILQEIPAKHVCVFRRQGNLPIVDELGVECFGENLTVITDDVFEASELRNNYRSHLKELSESYSYQQILDLFDGRLGFNAKAFLSTLYVKGK
jgi:predicted ATPase